jgi:hypothetical protein
LSGQTSVQETVEVAESDLVVDPDKLTVILAARLAAMP